MLSPTMQQTFLLGTLDTVKSLLIGFLLAAFQITAPESVRLPLIGVLEKIAQGKAMLDGELVKAGMSPRADHFAPTFEDLNNLQSIMEDSAFLCSTEYQTLLEQVDRSAIIHIILELMRIPVTAEFRELRCGKHTPRPFLEELVARGKAAEPEAAEEPKEIEAAEEPKEAEPAEEPKEAAEEPKPTEEPKEPEPTEEPKEAEAAEEPKEPAEEPKEAEIAEEPKEAEAAEEPKEPEPTEEPKEAEAAEEPKEPAEEPKEPEAAEEPKEAEEPKPVPLPPTIGGRRRRPHRL
jgi:chemotaxis protein histidine kinase CheA